MIFEALISEKIRVVNASIEEANALQRLRRALSFPAASHCLSRHSQAAMADDGAVSVTISPPRRQPDGRIERQIDVKKNDGVASVVVSQTDRSGSSSAGVA